MMFYKLFLISIILFLANTSIPNFEINIKILPFADYVAALNYPVETHKITTEDGYILTFFRIQAKNQTQIKTGLPVIYLQHGLMDSADAWVVNDEENAPGLRLANQGYDVWLGNVRGNKYSREHVNLSRRDLEFWQFTFQNMSRYDLPASFEYIHNFTGGEMINYVGHSQGTLIMFAALCEQNPTILKYIRKYVAISPVVFVQNIKSGPILISARTPILKILQDLGQKQFMPAHWATSKFSSIYCKYFVGMCADFLGKFFGSDPENDNYARYDIIMAHEPGGTSILNMLHLTQFVSTGKFNKYDFGTKGNLLHYNQTTPPDYDLSNVKIPVHLFVGSEDAVVDQQDVQTLLNALAENPGVNYKLYKSDHVTFLWGKDISFYFNDLLSALQEN